MCLGVPGQILEVVDRELLVAVADVAGVRRKVNITCIVNDEHGVDDCIGDWVLIHVGFAMAQIDEEEAAETLKVLTAMGELQAELASMQNSGDAP
ncbi:MAG: HypC/HybG/HupF family hydrogenase formation chaperone [Sphingomonas sp.]|nr:HypC/HybG/HupF family hydrogenase formation chaperone [Sphingomonas sp.]